MEPLRRAILAELVGDPETLIVDSTLREVLHPRQVGQSAGFEGAAWVRWGSFAVYGVKLHLICSTNRVPISYELTAANVADALLVRELVAAAGLGEGDLARRLLGDLAYRDGRLAAELAEGGILLATEKADRRPPIRQQVEVCLATLKRVFGMDVTLAKTLTGWPLGSRRKWRPTPTAVISTGCSVVPKGASGTCGHENLATLI